MPWNPDHKAQSKKKILDCAAGLFASQGYDGVSIDEIMREAGLTRGAFYAHFKSKGDIYSHAIMHAAQCAGRRMNQHANGNPVTAAKFYLSMTTSPPKAASRKLAGKDYCPLACLISDIAQQEDSVKHTYTQVLKGFQRFYEEQGLSHRQAIQVTTQIIGALALSQTVTDEGLKTALLESALEAVQALTQPLAQNT